MKTKSDFISPKNYLCFNFEGAIGYWTMGDSIRFGMRNKPTEEQIKNTEQLLGWKWGDINSA